MIHSGFACFACTVNVCVCLTILRKIQVLLILSVTRTLDIYLYPKDPSHHYIYIYILITLSDLYTCLCLDRLRGTKALEPHGPPVVPERELPSAAAQIDRLDPLNSAWDQVVGSLLPGSDKPLSVVGSLTISL